MKHLVIHTYGPGKFFVVVHIEVDSKVDVMISHELVDQIEHDFREEFGLELTGHLDPIDTKDAFTLELKEYVREIIDKLKIKYSSKINFHDFRVAGDCKISNGVRKYYVMGVRVSKGAWEVVNITSACCELVEEDA